MPKTVEFKYSMGDSVKIDAIGIIGRVESMCVDNCGDTYRVVYWNDGMRCSVWMYNWEIKEVK